MVMETIRFVAEADICVPDIVTKSIMFVSIINHVCGNEGDSFIWPTLPKEIQHITPVH